MRFSEQRQFGSNPARLRMFQYVPKGLGVGAPLIVVLHGCRQTAKEFAQGAGWPQLAQRFGFALLLPQQNLRNNRGRCFNWFEPVTRDTGEALSIRQMIGWMLARHSLDSRRVFICGLSAGGAMAANMLAIYPELFAGGGIIAGLPYRAASNLLEAVDAMAHGRVQPAPAWGKLIRTASPHRGPWPRISVWHGSADQRVHPSNAEEIIKQWLDVHNITAAATLERSKYGVQRRVWRSPQGQEVIEAYTIAGMAHGAPILRGETGEDRGGGPFLLDVGVPSSLLLTEFWGVAEREAPVPRLAPNPVSRLFRHILNAAGLGERL